MYVMRDKLSVLPSFTTIP